MANQQKVNSKKAKSAVERLAALETQMDNISKNVASLLNDFNKTTSEKIGILADEIDKQGAAIKTLRSRISAVMEVTDTQDQVGKKIIEANIEELKAKIEVLTNTGALVLDNDSQISDKSFIVGRELDQEGNETNPRLQFPLATLSEELQLSLVGKSVGDLVEFEDENAPNFEITEIYTIQEITQNFAEEDSQESGAEEEAQDVDLEDKS